MLAGHTKLDGTGENGIKTYQEKWQEGYERIGTQIHIGLKYKRLIVGIQSERRDEEMNAQQIELS